MNKFGYFLLMISLLAVSCGKKETATVPYTFKDSDTYFMVTSDTHTLAPSLLDEKRDYDSELFVSDGRTMNYNPLLLDKLIDQALMNHPDYFIITGDISYNGSKISHDYIASRLKVLTENDIAVLVIPGNHDLRINNCRDYSSTDYARIPTVDEEEYLSIYADLGYNYAKYRDPDGLSYIVETKNAEWFLMLNTSLYRYNDSSYNYVGGYFEDMDWLREKLAEAKKNHIKVYSFTHHNLITHNPVFESKYTIGNHEELMDLYKEFNVQVNFSGHLHTQNIISEDGIYDICSGSLLDFGNRYGNVHLGEEGMEYLTENIDFKLDDGSSFHDYSFALFQKAYLRKNTDDEETKFHALLNAYYFDGSLYEHPELKKNRYYKAMADDSYIQSIRSSYDINHNFLQIPASTPN